MEFDRKQLATTSRQLEFNSERIEMRLTWLEANFAPNFDLAKLFSNGIQESRQVNSVQPLLDIEPLALLASIDEQIRTQLLLLALLKRNVRMMMALVGQL